MMKVVHIQLMLVAMEIALGRRRLEGISPMTACGTGPQVAPYVNMYVQVKATRHLAAAMLSGCATPTIANISIENEQIIPPAMSRGRRPKYLTNGKAEADPARPQMLVMTVTVNGFEMPLVEKKYVPYLYRLAHVQDVRSGSSRTRW